MARAMVIALGSVVAGGAVAAKGERPPGPVRILFVGNSYTYTNDLPYVVSLVAAIRGVEVVPGMLAEPNYALEDHIRSGAYDAVLQQGWDWVVLQQGPSSLPENRANLRYWAGRAADSAHALGAQVSLMSAWPALDNANTWLAAELSYHEAAIASAGCVLPVATAWRFSRESLPSIALYQDDRLHPEREGTLLAALVIVRGIFDARLTPDPPDTRGMIEDSGWFHALTQTAALDRVAQRAILNETARCSLAKSKSADPQRGVDP